MSLKDADIRVYQASDQQQVIGVWRTAGITTEQNDSVRDIDLKLQVDPDLFLVMVIDKRVIGTVMGGYEGHRGWINYLAVHPAYQSNGAATALMAAVERKLLQRGCPKINLQVRDSNTRALKFYVKRGYLKDDVISLGKRLT